MIKNKVSNKVYVGSSFNIRKRKDDHLMYLRKGNHKNTHLQSSWNKHGEKNFEWVVLHVYEERPELQCLLDKEQYYIDSTECTNREKGYNINLLSSGSIGVKRRPETLIKLSKAKKGIKQSKEIIEKRTKKLYKPILQYDLEGNFIKEWGSVNEASDAFNIDNGSFSKAIKRKGTSAGFLWRYKKSENMEEKIEAFKRKSIEGLSCKTVEVYNKKMELIDICSSVNEASRKYKHDVTVIRRTSKQRVFKRELMFIIKNKNE